MVHSEPSIATAAGHARHDADADPTGFEHLIAECLEAFDQKGMPAVDTILRDHPAVAADVRAALSRLMDTGLVQDEDREFPERMGDFELIRRIGGGGMGVVFLARQRSLDREVALKLIRPDFLYFENARHRFRREVRAVSRLKHPGIVPVWHVGEEGGIPYFAMEYIPGCSLSEMLAGVRELKQSGTRAHERRGGLMRDGIRARSAAGREETHGGEPGLFAGSWEQACLRVTLSIAEAMCHAHERNIVHRDLKPSNVMITVQGLVRLVDFGLAFLESDERLTRSNAMLGSLHYMSPEQICHDDLDGRADVYALGATLYELLSLSTPFGGDDPAKVRERILQGNLASLRRVAPSVSRDTETIVEKAMALRREARYPSMAAFAADLRNVLELRPINARPPSLLHRTTRWAQRNAVLSMAMLVLLVLGVSMTVLWWQQRQANRDLAAEQIVSARLLREANEANSKLAQEQALSQERLGVANANFLRAKAAIDAMLAQVATRDLASVPHVAQLRKRLLLDAMQMYRELSRQEYGHDQMQLELAVIEVRTGKMHLDVGEVEAAERHAAAGCKRLRELVARVPVGLSKAHLGDSLRYLAHIRRRMGDAAAAHRLLREAVELLESVREEMQDDPNYLHFLASAYRGLATLYQQEPDLQPPETFWRRDFGELAFALRRDHVKRFPGDERARDYLAREHRRRGARLMEEGELQQALAELCRALSTFTELAGRQEPGQYLLSNIAQCQTQIGHVHGRLKDTAAAIEAFEAAIATRRDLLQRFPGFPEHLGHLAGLLNDRAIIDIHARRAEAAEKLLREAIELQQQADRVFPDHEIFRDYLRNQTINLCNSLLLQGEHRELAAIAAQLPGRDRIAARGQLDAARYLGWSIALGDLAAGEDEAARKVLAARRDAVFEHLRNAVAGGYVTATALAQREFSALRDDPRFAELGAAVERRAQGGR